MFAPNTFAYTSPGESTGFVNDFAHILTSEQINNLELKLKEFEGKSQHEITLVTIKSLGGDTIENFAVKLFAEWGIGKKKSDNGVLILIAVDDYKMRIEVGYGLEGALTDAQSNWIINNIMKPAFRNNDFYSGIDGAIDKIISATKGEIVPSQKSDNRVDSNTGEMIVLFLFVGLSWLGSILGRSKSWWAGGIVGGTIGIILGLIYGFVYTGIISIILLAFFGLIFDAAVSKNYSRNKTLGRNPSWWAGGRGFGGGGGGGGFGGFGGGGSGGGGSSGSW